ncbi:glycine oxidase ThiO [Marinobacterium sediminicola]|uniref:Glycine oxidase n=1 Tax=Marinobacterium sediminicola TaxID=518898 RepID=A0ABY1RZH3_9GAMM|nr:glycine oxidase ThiO [Marinobacterium sediminicola]ULG68980.1 glycine oxidase ThiO [Marinobacterium sediminicola]SMR73826.1 glycine oxidase [Marinobacterium sediminicola]
MSEFLIVGAGVIGLMTARLLAQSGAKVKLIERGQSAREASWAGGGIVSPLYPWRYQDEITALALWSQSSYVHLAQELLAETGCDPELRQKGMLMINVADEADALAWAKRFHRPLTKVDAEFIYRTEPHLAPGFESAIWMPEVASIRNPRLGQALRKSAQLNPNITLCEESEVIGFTTFGERVNGVKTAHGEHKADEVILAGGAWSGQLLAQLGLELPVEPVRGQMMVFKAVPGVVERVVMLDGRYVIPRSDGRVLVGSTLEHVGFDKSTTEDASRALFDTATRIVPELADYEVEHHWAGLRPGSPNGVPFIGAVPGWKGLHLNTGHYRNGLVLAPASTRLLADLLLERSPVIDPDAYSPAGRLKAR